MLGEDDQMEYMVYLSEKEAFKFDSTLHGMTDEDEDLKAALDASMRVHTSEQSQQVQMENSITPSRKRSYGELVKENGVGGAGDGCSPSSLRLGHERHDEPSSYAKAVKGESSIYVDTRLRGPISKE